MKISISLPDELYKKITARDRKDRGLSWSIYTDIDRYLRVMSASKPSLIENEAMLLCDVHNGTILQSDLAEHYNESLCWNVEDSEPDGVFEKWKVDKEKFLKKIRSFTPAEACSVVDSIEQWWEQDKPDSKNLRKFFNITK